MSQCLLIEMAAHASDFLLPVGAVIVNEPATASDTLLPAGSAVMLETATARDALDFNRGADIVEAAHAGDLFSVFGHPLGSVSESARAHDRLLVSTQSTITETARAADTVVDVPRPAPIALVSETAHAQDVVWHGHDTTMVETAHAGDAIVLIRSGRLAETAHAQDTLTTIRHPLSVLVETARAGDRITAVRLAQIAETARAADTLRGAQAVVLAERAAASDEWLPTAHPIVVLREAAHAQDMYIGIRSPVALISERAWADDMLLPPGGNSSGWTANTDTWGMSRYVDWPIVALAEIGGVLYGAAADGLHRLDADTDAGQPIAGSVSTGMESLGSDAVKHLRNFYTGALVSVPGGLNVTVRDTTSGHKSPTYTYTFEPRHGDDYAPQRAVLGRGLRSRYFQFTVGNIGGADFTIDTAAVLADETTRRV